MTDVVLVLTTVPSVELGATIARILVDERLAACVNVLPPMTSFYRWQGSIEQATESPLIIKATRAAVPAIDARVRELHTYDLPELLVLGVEDGGKEYLAWIIESTAR